MRLFKVYEIIIFREKITGDKVVAGRRNACSLTHEDTYKDNGRRDVLQRKNE